MYLNEFELIKRITHGVKISDGKLIQGVGDDCAVIAGESGIAQLLTTDALFEGIHFKKEWMIPRAIGRKALSVNISDIAAMGGKPLYYLVSVGIPKGMPDKDIENLFEGMAQVAMAYRMVLIGGDTCGSGNGLLLSLTVIGEVEHSRCVFRKGAKAGDAIFITGTLGEAALGLACLSNRLRNMEVRDFIKRHDDPIPRVLAGQWFSASGCVSSMIDVSDGLAADLMHIAEASGVGMRIGADKIPLSNEFKSCAGNCGKDPLMLALTGGEDYELAFTVSGGKTDLFEKMLRVVMPTFRHAVTRIGEVVEGSGVLAVDAHGANIPLHSLGFEHKF